MESQRWLPFASACWRSGGNVLQLPPKRPSSRCCSEERLDQGTGWADVGAPDVGAPGVGAVCARGGMFWGGDGGCCAHVGRAAPSSISSATVRALIIFFVSGRRRRDGRDGLRACARARIGRLGNLADISLRQIFNPASIVRALWIRSRIHTAEEFQQLRIGDRCRRLLV